MRGSDIAISEAATPHEIEAIHTLFQEYASSLDFSLGFQGFDEELAALPGKYSLPGGCLLLATSPSGQKAGCVGIRPIDASDAEMKRLYVRPDFRGFKFGKRLAEASMAFARRAGYATLRLDTISDRMAAADRLYRDMGFVETAPYYDNPVAGARFYALDLSS